MSAWVLGFGCLGVGVRGSAELTGFVVARLGETRFPEVHGEGSVVGVRVVDWLKVSGSVVARLRGSGLRRRCGWSTGFHGDGEDGDGGEGCRVGVRLGVGEALGSRRARLGFLDCEGGAGFDGASGFVSG